MVGNLSLRHHFTVLRAKVSTCTPMFHKQLHATSRLSLLLCGQLHLTGIVLNSLTHGYHHISLFLEDSRAWLPNETDGIWNSRNSDAAFCQAGVSEVHATFQVFLYTLSFQCPQLAEIEEPATKVWLDIYRARTVCWVGFQ